MQRRSGTFIWVHVVLQVRDSQDNSQQPVIVCTNQVLRLVLNVFIYHVASCFCFSFFEFVENTICEML